MLVTQLEFPYGRLSKWAVPYFYFMIIYINSQVLWAYTQVYEMGVYFCHHLKVHIVVLIFLDLFFFVFYVFS